jgi:MFS family permease
MSVEITTLRTGGTGVAGMAESRSVWRSKTLYLVVSVGMLAPLDVPLVGPVLPQIATAFGVSNARAGLVVTAFAAPGVFFAPILGWLADRYGRRRVLLPTLLVYGTAGVAVAFAESFTHVLVLRAFQGMLGGSILSSLALTLAGDVYSGTRRNAAMGVTSAGLTLSAALAPFAGGVLGAYGWNVPFLLYGLSVVVAVAVFLWLPEPARDDAAKTDAGGLDYLRSALDAVPVRSALGVYGAAFLAYTLLFGAALTAIPFLLDEGFGVGSARIGTVLTAASLVGAGVALVNGRLAERFESHRLVALGLCGYGVGLLGISVADSPLAIGVGLTVFGVGHGLTQPSVAALLSSLAPTRFRGGIMSLRTSIVLASQAVGPPLFTLPAAVGYGYQTLLGAAGIVAVAVGLVAVVLTRQSPTRSRRSAT